MQKCLILINDNAGKCKKCSVENVRGVLGDFDFCVRHLSQNLPLDLEKFDSVAVCGGDGTLQSVMQVTYNQDKTVYYFPCGTLNDKAKAEKFCHTTQSPRPVTIGKIGNDVFTYVLASGAFTEIGYTAGQDSKKKYGVLAYVFKVLKAYRINRIRCKVSINDFGTTKDYVGEFNLVMFIKSPRCFGFKFNDAFDENDDGGHLLMIRSPRHNGLLGLVEMFFPFFRVFFLGLDCEREDNIIFKYVKNATMYLNDTTKFCVDGEMMTLSGQNAITFEKTKCKLKIFQID